MNLKRCLLACTLAIPAQGWCDALFINDATVHTMGPRTVLQDTDILVRDGRVHSLGIDLEPPIDAVVIEADGRPVTPGLFAGITAHGLVEISMVEDTADDAAEVILDKPAMRPEFDVTAAYNPVSGPIAVTRIEGLTWAMLGAGQSSSLIGGQGRAVRFDGGWSSFAGEPVLYLSVGGAGSEQSGGSRAAKWMLLEQALAEAGSELSWLPSPLLTPAGREALAGFLETGLVVFGADRASDIVQVLAFSEKHGLNAAISGGAEAWMVADELAAAGVPVLLDPLANLPSNFDRLGARLDNAALLNEAGVNVVFSGAGTHNARKQRQAAGNAVANGLPWDAALAALTAVPADIFGLDGGAGRIEPGSPADLVLWSGDPLEVTTWAEQVIVGGKPVDMVSRQTLLRDRYLESGTEMPRAYVKP
jgi:hypothetical protein